MKFETEKYLKHKNCLDVFIKVHSVVMDTGTHTIIQANWMVQGIDNIWYASNIDRIFIKPDQYEKWQSYAPKGEVKYV